MLEKTKQLREALKLSARLIHQKGWRVTGKEG
jgi:hypothetical protein